MPVIYMDRASAESLTEKDIREIIDENLMDLKYGMLTDYYVGQHRILSETKKDSTAPNNHPSGQSSASGNQTFLKSAVQIFYPE